MRRFIVGLLATVGAFTVLSGAIAAYVAFSGALTSRPLPREIVLSLDLRRLPPETPSGDLLTGLGLMLRSQWDVHAHLERGELVHVLPGWAMVDADVHLVLPPRDLRLAAPRRLKLLQDHLVAAFAHPPWAAPVSAPPARRRAP